MNNTSASRGFSLHSFSTYSTISRRSDSFAREKFSFLPVSLAEVHSARLERAAPIFPGLVSWASCHGERGGETVMKLGYTENTCSRVIKGGTPVGFLFGSNCCPSPALDVGPSAFSYCPGFFFSERWKLNVVPFYYTSPWQRVKYIAFLKTRHTKSGVS